MKNGKLPTRNQKFLLRFHGMSPEEWLVVKDTSEYMEVVSRIEIKRGKISGKPPKTRRLFKE